MKDHSENRTENRTNNCKNQSQNRTTNQTTNEHKHPNQYTKGADDEGAKNKKLHRIRKPAAFPALFSSAESSGLSRFISGSGQTAATRHRTALPHGPSAR